MAFKMVVSQEIVDYLQRFYNLGAFEQDENGALEVNPQLEEVFEAAHAILAGGSATISITGGDEAKMADLDNLRRLAVDSVQDLDLSGGDAPMAP